MTSSPFFIVGHVRSGTTLTAAILDRHSKIAVPPETHFFTQVCQDMRADQTADRQFMVDRFFDRRRVRDLGLHRDELLQRLETVEPTWANLFLEALKLYAQRRGKAIIGEKTPDHSRHASQLLGLFPASHLIWVIRDGRDAVLSLMNVPWKKHSHLALHALNWQSTITRMLACERQFPGRILRVRFEDLVTSPQAEATRLCDFLGVDFEPRQLDPSMETGVVPAWEMDWKGKVFEPPDASRIGTARRDFDEKSLQLVEAMMGPCLRQLGYDVAPDALRVTNCAA
ncbi:MAG: sulfotransferase [Tepidisphaeraceae bacterium]